MKIDVRQQRADDAPLRGTSITGPEGSVCMNTRLEEAFDVTQNAFIGNAVTEKFHQAVVIHVVEEAMYIGLDDMVDLSAFDGFAQRTQCIVTAPFRSKSI